MPSLRSFDQALRFWGLRRYCIFALAKQAKALQANKLARFALEKLTQFKASHAPGK